MSILACVSTISFRYQGVKLLTQYTHIFSFTESCQLLLQSNVEQFVAPHSCWHVILADVCI